ncbi:recombination regulator RecX [Bacillus sp. CLL-7-23]|uniref:Regulatory protein RecX n=1 Tax=Bacillus changyiensis TaxID=3004103 RepID=A0ABT4X2X8_9BACI|nr:recombination regulator RecX [Bacillus changyiensis]MDA7026636.1 recombination regulator RecX [Bacillus changyiensis]
MPYITKITTQKNNEKRVNIFLDEKYAFSVDLDVLVKFNLKKGNQLDELDIIEIQYGDEIKKGFNKALDYLSYRKRSTKEVRDHLKKKGCSDASITEIIHMLRDYKYIDDHEFAVAYVNTYRKTKGPDVLQRELQLKGIDQELIEEALNSFTFEEQVKAAVKHVEKWLKKEKKVSAKATKQAIEQQLIRKGFSFDVIAQAELESDYEHDENAEWEALKKQADKAMQRYHYNGSYETKMKVKQFLFRKGFSPDMIEQYLNEEG